MGNHMTEAAGEHHPAHHFESTEHEFDSCKQGMWLFLLQEVLFFSGLFVAFFIFRALFFGDFQAASEHLDAQLGAINTAVLICSSLTMARAVTSAQLGYQKATVINLSLTFVLASGFLIIKYLEYTHKFHIGLLPGGYFGNPSALFPQIVTITLLACGGLMLFCGALPKPGLRLNKVSTYFAIIFIIIAAFLFMQYLSYAEHPHGPIEGGLVKELQDSHPKAPLYYSLYYFMTGLHGAHVVAGMIAILWVLSRAENREFGSQYYTPVEMVGLYWHFVDLVWIFLFPLLYLVD